MNLADPLGLWASGSYAGDVGLVFKGYGQAVWGTVRSSYDMYQYFSANGVSATSVRKLVVGGAQGWYDGITGTDPEKFGNSMGATLITVGTAAAPFAKGTGWGKVPFARNPGVALSGSKCGAISRVVYRGGSDTLDNLTPRPGIDTTGLSTFDRLEAAVRPGGKAQVIDVSRLRQLNAVRDSSSGHVSLTPGNPSLLAEWAATRGTGVVHPLTQEIQNALVGVARRTR